MAAALLAMAPSAQAQGTREARVRVALRGAFATRAGAFTEARPFTEFAERGEIDSRYTQGSGPGGEAGLTWLLARRLGIVAAAAFAQRREAGAFSAALPHPLYFGMPRHAEGDFRGKSERETAVHLDLAVLGAAGRLDWSLFAGPSLVGVRADLVSAVEYTQAYPYDRVTVTGAPLVSARGRGLGANAGAALDWRAARRVALGVQARFCRARARLRPLAEDEVDVRAGGLALAAGLRIDF